MKSLIEHKSQTENRKNTPMELHVSNFEMILIFKSIFLFKMVILKQVMVFSENLIDPLENILILDPTQLYP